MCREGPGAELPRRSPRDMRRRWRVGGGGGTHTGRSVPRCTSAACPLSRWAQAWARAEQALQCGGRGGGGGDAPCATRWRWWSASGTSVGATRGSSKALYGPRLHRRAGHWHAPGHCSGPAARGPPDVQPGALYLRWEGMHSPGGASASAPRPPPPQPPPTRDRSLMRTLPPDHRCPLHKQTLRCGRARVSGFTASRVGSAVACNVQSNAGEQWAEVAPLVPQLLPAQPHNRPA